MKTITHTIGVSRSNQYEQRKDRGRYNKPDDGGYLALIKEITDERTTYGYRRVTALLNRHLAEKGQPRVNHKRIYRIMKIHNLLLPKYTGRAILLHEGTIITLASNMRWCSDIFEIPCWNGERIRVIFALDCCDREILSYLATTGGITAEMVKDVMALAIEYRFSLVDRLPHIIEWLSDNGSSYTAHDTITFARLMGLEPCTTAYRSPESNGMAEAFVKTFKRDYVSMHQLPDARTVMKQLPSWFEDYNEYHPHKGLKMRSPREYRRSENKLEGCPV
jgi:transposase InsO family protein